MIPPTTPSPRSEGLPRSERIRRSREFRDVSRRGRRRRSQGFVVLTVPRPGGRERGRLGVTVSRKVGNAVVRNAVKRRIREWFRTHGVADRPLELVVIARPAAAGLSSREVARQLDPLIEGAS